MKKSQMIGTGLGAVIGLLTAAVTYLIIWSGFGSVLAGPQSALIPLLSVFYPAACGAILVGFYVDGPGVFKFKVLQAVVLAVGFVLGVFVWRYGVHLVDVFLSGSDKIKTLGSICFLAMPIAYGIRLVIKRP